MADSQEVGPGTIPNVGGPGEVENEGGEGGAGAAEAVAEDHAESHQRLRRGRE